VTAATAAAVLHALQVLDHARSHDEYVGRDVFLARLFNTPLTGLALRPEWQTPGYMGGLRVANARTIVSVSEYRWVESHA
jgi:hypothetical protein